MPRKRKYLLLFVILFSILIISGCSAILFGPSGSIKVKTNPSGAEIFLDGKDTGKMTPYTLRNVSAGNHIIEVTLSDFKYTEIAEVKAYQTTNINIEFYSQITLDKINVLPSTTNITLSLGNTVTISSVTAYYSDYSSTNIPLTNCTYSSNDACAIVNSSGTITGISAGAAIITVSYTEGETTKTDTVLVYIRNDPTDTPISPPIEEEIQYRALCVGVGDYQYGDNDLQSPPYNVDMMYDTLSHSGDGFVLINKIKDLDATKNAILNGIANTFSEADTDDISYFYFNGHGLVLNDVSYLCPTDVNGYVDSAISISELESTLSAIPGTKVVFLDSCHSGGFIGKEVNYKDMANYSRDFNDNVINVFGIKAHTKDLANPQYQVLTSCLSTQECSEIIPSEGEPWGLFSTNLCEGCGYNYYSHPYFADTNANGEITLNETYVYADQQVNTFSELYNATHTDQIDQDTQVYPVNSNFVIILE